MNVLLIKSIEQSLIINEKIIIVKKKGHLHRFSSFNCKVYLHSAVHDSMGIEELWWDCITKNSSTLEKLIRKMEKIMNKKKPFKMMTF